MSKKTALNYHGLDPLKARYCRQEICQFRWRPDYAKPHDGQIPSKEEMICDILHDLMQESGAPRRGLAFVLDRHFTMMGRILDERKWPKGLEVESTFREAVQWIVMGRDALVYGNQAKETNSPDAAKRRELLEKVARDIEQYFFPPPHQANSAEPQYFNPFRRLSEAPHDKIEISRIIEFTRRQIKLRNEMIEKKITFGAARLDRTYPGQLIIVAMTSDAIRVFDDSQIRKEIALAAVQSRHFQVVLLSRAADPDAARFSDWLNRECERLKLESPSKRTGAGLHPVPVSADPELAHRLFGYLYFSYGPRVGHRARVLVVRTLGGGEQNVPLTFTATPAECETFLAWVQGHSVTVLR